MFLVLFILAPNKVFADNKYYVKVLKSDKTTTEIGSYNTYTEALTNMNNYNSTFTDANVDKEKVNSS